MNINVASCWQMREFVFKQIAHHPIQQRHISSHDHMVREVDHQIMLALGHRWLVYLYHLLHEIRKVYGSALKTKGSGLCFKPDQARCLIGE